MKEQNKEVKEASMKTQRRKNFEHGSCQAKGGRVEGLSGKGWKGFPVVREDCQNKNEINFLGLFLHLFLYMFFLL